MSDRLRAVLGERYGEVIERAARAMHMDAGMWLWEDLIAQEPAWAQGWLDNAREALAAVLPDLLAEAWDEGHETPWKREPDDCECYAYSRNECGCGRYGMGRIITPNPYREETKP